MPRPPPRMPRPLPPPCGGPLPPPLASALAGGAPVGRGLGTLQAVLPFSALMQNRLSLSERPKIRPFFSTGVLNCTAVSLLFQSSLAARLSPSFSILTALVPLPDPE